MHLVKTRINNQDVLVNIVNHDASAATSGLSDIYGYLVRAFAAVDLLQAASPPVDPIYARFGVTATNDANRLAATNRARESLDYLEEALGRGAELAAGGRAELAEARAHLPRVRTRAFNVTVARYATLLDSRDALLDAYGALRGELEERYWEAPLRRQADLFLHSNQQMLYGQSPREEIPTHGGGRLGGNTDATLVAIVAMSLLLLLSMPSFCTFVLRDPRQQPYKNKKKKKKPQHQHQRQRQPTAPKRTNQSKQKTPDKPKKYSPTRPRTKTRKTHSYETATVDETKRCKQRWMERMHRVHAEARAQFKRIRQELDARNLERARPKGKRTPSKCDPSRATPVRNPSLAGIGGKAGKSQYLIQAGAVEHLHKTSKPSPNRIKGRALPCIPCVDLHGMTKTNALRELDDGLPRWIEAAMRGSYPWVMPVRIICGGGNQILSEAVVGWIRENKQVSNAPKDLML